LAGFFYDGALVFRSRIYANPFNIFTAESGENFSIRVCLKYFKQGPVDPDQQINQGLMVCLKNYTQGPVKKFQAKSARNGQQGTLKKYKKGYHKPDVCDNPDPDPCHFISQPFPPNIHSRLIQ